MYVLVCILLALLGRAVIFNIWDKSIRKLLGVLINKCWFMVDCLNICRIYQGYDLVEMKLEFTAVNAKFCATVLVFVCLACG